MRRPCSPLGRLEEWWAHESLDGIDKDNVDAELIAYGHFGFYQQGLDDDEL